MKDTRTLQEEEGFIQYVLENCERALDELKQLNTELSSVADIKRTGNLHRIVQDYLIVRVAGLFDNNPTTISLAKWFTDNSSYERIRKEEIIQYLLKTRHNFVAHNNQENISGDFFPNTAKILNSNLRLLLVQLKNLL